MTPREQQSGFLAIVAAIVLVVLAAMGAAMFAMTTSGTRGAGDHARSGRALFAAESGLEWAAKQMYDSGDPPGDCSALTNGPHNLPTGQFQITNSSFDSSNTTCSVTSVGTVGDVVRTLNGTIPEAIIDPGGGNLFEDAGDNFNPCGPPNHPDCSNDAITFYSWRNPDHTRANGSSYIDENFSDGEDIYLAFDLTQFFGWQIFSQLRVRLNIQGAPNVTCNISINTLGHNCPAPGGSTLASDYGVVLYLGDDFSTGDVQQLRFEMDWGIVLVDTAVQLTNGCLGTESYCSGGGSVPSDPVEDDTWGETP